MGNKSEKEQFVISDKRKFTSDGALRNEGSSAALETPSAPEAGSRKEVSNPTPASEPQIRTSSADSPSEPQTEPQTLETPPLSPQTQREAEMAYNHSNKQSDLASPEGAERTAGSKEDSSQSFEMTFERLIVSLYMTAMMQLGMAHPEGETPRIDIIGARQTIDTLALLNDKTRGNLTGPETNLLQNCLFELRMAYVETANRIVQPPASDRGPGIQ